MLQILIAMAVVYLGMNGEAFGLFKEHLLESTKGQALRLIKSTSALVGIQDSLVILCT